jgi:hypothetical protein
MLSHSTPSQAEYLLVELVRETLRPCGYPRFWRDDWRPHACRNEAYGRPLACYRRTPPMTNQKFEDDAGLSDPETSDSEVAKATSKERYPEDEQTPANPEQAAFETAAPPIAVRTEHEVAKWIEDRSIAVSPDPRQTRCSLTDGCQPPGRRIMSQSADRRRVYSRPAPAPSLARAQMGSRSRHSSVAKEWRFPHDA